ncbi:MAG: SufE family protein [Waddliaceae bacterium]|jgi:cysteine desulfuration protein SufE|nr:SufE family protein [Waddliaceae bacterium]MBT3579573.1 SufE family protein [Waddliaceae bacterium]MBT4444435.1 SufE family protein [Waddliaceae bacterium]MBT6928180.1 SufE family protein [Waddliaceae bacterium]MBT7264325.1 SufE family protein [Waddliaceae bacterium]
MPSLAEKQQRIKELFSGCSSKEEIYEKIIALGAELAPIPSEFKTAERRVPGCQSNAFLDAHLDNGGVVFEGTADALISAGLMYLLISVYSGETPETILTEEPRYLEEIGITKSITIGRSNGLASMMLRMKQEALKLLQ